MIIFAQGVNLDISSYFINKMVNILEIKNSNLTEKIEAHEKIGGALRISVFEIKENALYQFCPNGYSQSKLTNSLIDKSLGLVSTTRNWKTL